MYFKQKQVSKTKATYQTQKIEKETASLAFTKTNNTVISVQNTKIKYETETSKSKHKMRNTKQNTDI